MSPKDWAALARLSVLAVGTPVTEEAQDYPDEKLRELLTQATGAALAASSVAYDIQGMLARRAIVSA